MLTSKNLTIVCPVCHQPLESNMDIMVCKNSHEFQENNEDYMDLTWPKELLGNNATFYEQYKEIANFYDFASSKLFETFYCDEIIERKRIADRLDAKSGDHILELSAGTGLNLINLVSQIGNEGKLYALDLSPDMLKEAIKKADAYDFKNIEFIVANGSYLPFADNQLDGVFHIGGINTFTEVEKALQELVRVVKPGGRIVLCDEGMAPWLLDTPYGKELAKMNQLYKIQPPLNLLPANVVNVNLSWIMGNAFFVLDFVVGEHELTVNPAVQEN